MGKHKNTMAKGFLARYRIKTNDDTAFLPLNNGFLRLEYGRYDDPNALAIVSFVREKTRDAFAVGPRLEMRLFPEDRESIVTFISENAVSGLQWKRGKVIWGHMYEYDGPGTEGRSVSLEKWTDWCVHRMINSL